MLRQAPVPVCQVYLIIVFLAPQQLPLRDDGQLPPCGVHKDADLGIGICSQRGQNGFRIEVRAAHVAFQTKMILSNAADNVCVICRKSTSLLYRAKRQKTPLPKKQQRGYL